MISNDFLIAACFVLFTLLLTWGVMVAFPSIFSIRTLRLPGIFIMGYVAMILLPLPFIYAEYPELARDRFLAVTNISFLLMISGVLFTAFVLPIPQHPKLWMLKATQTTPSMELATIGLLVLCYVIVFMYIQYLGSLPILDAIRGIVIGGDLVESRENALKLLPKAIALPVSYLRTLLFPVTTLILLSLALLTRWWRWRLIFLVAFTGNLLIAAATLEKSPVGALFMMLVLTGLAIKGKPFALSKIILISCLILVFPVFVMLLIYQFDIEVGRLVNALFQRIFWAPAEVLLAYIDYFPEHMPFLGGRTLPQISKLVSGGPFWVENVICRSYFYPDQLTCHANSAYVGYLWVEFGWSGIMLGSVICGCIMQLVQWALLALKKTPPTVVLQAILSYHAFMLNSTSFWSFIDWGITGFVVILLIQIVPTLKWWTNTAKRFNLDFEKRLRTANS